MPVRCRSRGWRSTSSDDAISPVVSSQLGLLHDPAVNRSLVEAVGEVRPENRWGAVMG